MILLSPPHNNTGSIGGFHSHAAINVNEHQISYVTSTYRSRMERESAGRNKEIWESREMS